MVKLAKKPVPSRLESPLRAWYCGGELIQFIGRRLERRLAKRHLTVMWCAAPAAMGRAKRLLLEKRCNGQFLSSLPISPSPKLLMNSSQKPKIVDAHVHFYDHEQNRHDFLEHVDKMFEALIGNYSILPRQYFLDDYVADEPGLGLVVLVWQ